MNSLMFTFSSNQMSIQLNNQNFNSQSVPKSIRRRPSSSNPSQSDKSRILSSNSNQLFENSQFQSCAISSSPQKNITTMKIKNTSMQLQQKKKLRNIIDNMLGKNFDPINSIKMQQLLSNRKNQNKHRGYQNIQNNESKTKIRNENIYYYDDKQSKQNQFNFQNIDVKQKKQNLPQTLFNNQKHIIKRPNIKVKKFQFANIKLIKPTNNIQNSQRYSQASKDQQSICQKQKNCNASQQINISRSSIDRQSLHKRVLRSKTPKIMYPQSDSKLPSVFKCLINPNGRNSSENSVRKRNKRITSAHFISEWQDKKEHDSLGNSQKRTIIQNAKNMQPLIRTKLRPKSVMVDTSKKGSNLKQNLKQKSQQHNEFLYPKKLIFADCNQDLLSQNITRKLAQKSIQIQNKNISIRMGSRVKSVHGNYAHRKLKQMSSLFSSNIQNQDPMKSLEPRQCIKDYNFNKNLSHHSRQTAEDSTTLQLSTDRTLINISGKGGKSKTMIEEKIFQEKQLGCSITFHISPKNKKQCQ